MYEMGYTFKIDQKSLSHVVKVSPWQGFGSLALVPKSIPLLCINNILKTNQPA